MLPARIQKKIQEDPVRGCWLWIASCRPNGYAYIRWEGRAPSAHRVTFKLLRDPNLSDDLELDHTCRTRHCVNPWHLAPVTHKENVNRSNRHRLTTRCHAGHLREPGKKDCRECNTIRARGYRAKKKKGA